MSFFPVQVAVGLLFAALALWVLLAAPRAAANRALAVILLLFAGSTIVFQLMRDATSFASFSQALHAASLYEVPVPFFIALLVDALFLPQPRPRTRKVALAALAAWTTLLAGLLAATPWDVVQSVFPRPDGTLAFNLTETWPIALQGVTIFTAEAAALVLAARASVDPAQPPLRQRQAAMVAVAFGLLVGHTGGYVLGQFLDPASLTDPSHFDLLPATSSVITGATSVVASAYAALTVSRGTTGPRRVALTAAFVAPVLVGFFVDIQAFHVVTALFPLFVSTRIVWFTAFAVVLAVAILRFGLFGLEGSAARRAGVATGLLAFGLAGIGAGASLSAFGMTTPGWTGAGIALAAPLVLAVPQARGVPRRLAGALFLDPADPEVVRERARVYTTALRAGAAGEELRTLRSRLGLSERDHELLASVLDGGATPPEPGRLLLARYRLVRELGRGGFGEAWLARDEREGREVVLKRLVGEQRRTAVALRRFHREARLAGALRHASIVEVLRVESVGDETYLVMEYVPGGSLADRLVRGPLPELEALALAQDVAAALAALHARGVVHRDVKPSNILLTAEGRAKLGDFGLAHDLVSGETVGGTAPMGTYAYLAPEQARGKPGSARSDVYALGATLYEMLAGKPPLEVEGLTAYEAGLRIVQQEPRWPAPGASAGVDRVLRRALAKDPERRFADGEDFARSLREAALIPAGTPAGSARRRPRLRS